MKYIRILAISFLFISCSESKMLQRSLSSYKAPLEYLHDSQVTGCDQSVSVALDKFDRLPLDSLTTVSKISYKLLPFIVYNYEELNLSIKLGQKSLMQNYEDFFRKSFADESKRTGCYLLSDSAARSEYTIDVSVTTCTVNSVYQESTTAVCLFFAYSIISREMGFPAKTSLVLKVDVKKQNQQIFEKEYSIARTQPFVQSQSQNAKKLRSDFITNMAESLSLSTKDGIEQIIADINNLIETDKRQANTKSRDASE